MSFTNAVFVTIMTLSVGMTGPAQSYGTERVSSISLTKTTLTLRRIKTTKGAIIGKLYLNNELECYTLEDFDYQIPVGTYSLSKVYSEKFNHIVLKLSGVPGRSDIEIHPGNFKEDSKGCILVGKSHTDTSVVASRGALTHLLKQTQLPALIVIQDVQL